MSTIWHSHQRCTQCHWVGTTTAHRNNILNGLLYLLAVAAVVVAETVYSLDLAHRVSWPIALFAMVWFYGVPALLWRNNACRGCGQPMEVDLLPGRAPR